MLKTNLDSGINVQKLKPGTCIFVITKNHLYKLVKQDYGNKITVQGGKYFKQPTECYFSGSTFGGSAIKLYWIGYGMHMELNLGNKIFRTTPIQAAAVQKDEWYYMMDWE